jgi:hypothetical protein
MLTFVEQLLFGVARFLVDAGLLNGGSRVERYNVPVQIFDTPGVCYVESGMY